jgi:hypothetical protein
LAADDKEFDIVGAEDGGDLFKPAWGRFFGHGTSWR